MDRFVKKTVSGMVLLLLLTGMWTLAFNVQLVESTWIGTVYIRADGSVDPPDAPIKTYDKVTYMLTGNIASFADGIVVQRDNIIIDGAGHAVEGAGAEPYRGIDLTGRSNVTIKNMRISTFYYGIWLYGSSNNSISGNNITNNKHGIYQVIPKFPSTIIMAVFIAIVILITVFAVALAKRKLPKDKNTQAEATECFHRPLP